MNLSPKWGDALRAAGHEPVHWSEVGDPRATDRTVMEWARTNGHVVLTNDLDFGAILAATRARSPSVVQARAQDLAPDHLAPLLLRALEQHAAILEEGALVALDERGLRARILPLAPRSD